MSNKSPEKYAKVIRQVLDQVGNLGKWDSVPSYDDFGDVIFFKKDASNPASFFLCDEDEKPMFRVTVEKM